MEYFKFFTITKVTKSVKLLQKINMLDYYKKRLDNVFVKVKLVSIFIIISVKVMLDNMHIISSIMLVIVVYMEKGSKLLIFLLWQYEILKFEIIESKIVKC